MTLKELRKSKGLSQLDASKIVKVPLRTYKRYENDNSYQKSFKYGQICRIIEEFAGKLPNENATKNLRIAVAGIGYVGLSLATLFAENNNVIITDIIKEKIDLVNNKKSPFFDKEISYYLSHKKLNLKAVINVSSSYKDVDVVIIATPTDFDSATNSFNTSNVESVIKDVYKVNKKALVVIKSTIPIGFTDEMNTMYSGMQIIFSPEFLREGHALEDNLYPSRIIIGANKVTTEVRKFASLLEGSAKNMNKAIYMTSSEAEATKLFSNAYLAMRVAYFNELDSYAKSKGLNTSNIIKGVGRDPRIGDYYNNPSFGYGGYCLPKDSEQLQSSFVDIPNNNLIKAIVDSNQTRKEYIANDVIKEAKRISGKNNVTIGIYSLAMKSGSDNYRSSSSVDVMNLLIEKGIKVIVYDKNYNKSEKDFDTFIKKSDLIIANRYSEELRRCLGKLYSRDIYYRD